jgi:hypothetical protein
MGSRHRGSLLDALGWVLIAVIVVAIAVMVGCMLSQPSWPPGTQQATSPVPAQPVEGKPPARGA